MALVGIELETLVSEPDALTTRPPPCAFFNFFIIEVYASQIMAPAGGDPETPVSEQDALTTRPWFYSFVMNIKNTKNFEALKFQIFLS